jgi:two-component system cell cycle response regulator
VARILIVDDNRDAREMYRMSLEFEGFDCAEAADGEACLAQIHADAPDLILMDATMPRLDGWECVTRIKADAMTRHIPVIMLTAHAFPEHRRRAEAIGADGFLTKPVLRDELATEIRRVLKAQSPTRRS